MEYKGEVMAALMKCFVEIRDETRANIKTLQDRETSITRSLTERHAASIQTILDNTKIMTQELHQHIETRIAQETLNERTTTEEQQKQHIQNVTDQLEAFENSMQIEGVYRDSIYTEHELATEQRLQDCM